MLDRAVVATEYELATGEKGGVRQEPHRAVPGSSHKALLRGPSNPRDTLSMP